MNLETVSLIERTYQEIVDDVLTAIVGGVVNEPIFFDVKDDIYPLAEPARDVRNITGTVSARDADDILRPKHFTFQKAVDFLFDQGSNAIIWESNGTKPDDETIFYVDYFRSESQSPLTDINVGSVTRTLSEAISREIATVYQQINEAYLAGFVDTARGQSLDLVVSILGVERKTKEAAVGLVTFFRDPGAGDGNITVPEGTVVSTDKGDATFITVQLRTLQRGQARIDLPIRAKEKGAEAKAGEIIRLAQPIAGIARVTNFEATALGAADETDEQLRARAKAALRGLGKATLAALTTAILEGRAKLVEVFDPNSAPSKSRPPGVVDLLIESEPERIISLRASVEQTRAAGVQASLIARYVFFKPRIRVRINQPGLTSAGKIKLVRQIIDAMQDYVDKLATGEPANGEELLKAVRSVKEIEGTKKDEKGRFETRFVDVMAWQSEIGKPDREALVKALVDAVSLARANETATNTATRDAALTTALTNVLSETEPTAITGRRIPNRKLVKGLGEQQATDAEIEAGTFKVTTPDSDGEKWWIVLDVEPGDIVLVEA